AGAAVAAAVTAAGLPHAYHADARLVIVRPERVEAVGLIVIAAAGTADLPVAEEAALVAEALGNRVERVYDCGVAGLHRLLGHYDLLADANAIVAVAGMEVALLDHASNRPWAGVSSALRPATRRSYGSRRAAPTRGRINPALGRPPDPAGLAWRWSSRV